MEICNYAKHHAETFETWGFETQPHRRGLNIVFSGQPGTGKTMAAEIIAGELKLDLFKLDLSRVVSKYIGETEKALNRIFKDAGECDAILFFDEADALFGKRNEVKDAHDRYANIEIDYLLSKMEEQKGIVILATNAREKIDDAFIRRINFIVEFPHPNGDCRLEIWKKMLQEKTHFDENDFESLSWLPITGGNIRNIALAAAFLARENSGKIQIKHIIEATITESQKPDFEKTYAFDSALSVLRCFYCDEENFRSSIARIVSRAVANYVFQPISITTLSSIKMSVREALVSNEPGIEVLEVNVSDERIEEGLLLISILYRVRSTNTKVSLVYPFCLREG
jgi:SpoVK/Ycf46/Vps4 family AAA+-type ATPase